MVAYSHTPIPPHSPRLSLPVFFITLAVYVALAPWMVKVWQRTGDEPHYLLAAHSLAFDGDFDLSNNYAQRDYLSFYGDASLNPHTRPGPDEQAVLTHNLGLSLLIAPAYRLGGFTGVEYFFALLGALLAANVFLLGYQLTHNWLAAAVGWLSVSFTPPVLWYVFLVYPEMVGGLCLILTLRHLLSSFPALESDRPQSPIRHAQRSRKAAICYLPFVISSFAIAFLPWLSSRYLPVFGLLIIGAMGRAWKERSRGWLLTALGGLAGLGAYALFSQWLYGNASPAASYAGPTQIGVDQSFALIRFARGVLGWLMDNQRGILVSAPIYAAALWGSALLLRRKPLAGLAVLLPFAATLLPVALWGGFWTAWEYSARFLVAALPPLGAGVAYLWAAGRRAVVIPLTAMLLGLSLLVGRTVIAAPIKGIISGPIEWLKPKLDLEVLIPAMAGYAFIPAGHDAVVGTEVEQGWQALKGQNGIVLRQVDVPELPFGWYTARLPLGGYGAGRDMPVATIKVFSPRGGNYFSQTVYGRDLSRGQGVITFGFANPLYDHWAFPPTVLVSSTGEADLSLGTLVVEPERFHSLILPALWLAALALVGVGVIARASEPRRRVFPGWLSLPLTVALVFVALASFAFSLQPRPRTYATVDLERTVGVVVHDPLAYRGQAMEASPDAGQEAGMLAATLPEVYAPGRYRLIASIRAISVSDPGLSPARVRVLAPGAAPTPNRWDVPGTELPADGQYHHFAFDFENPRQQALTFILDYPATAGLRADTLVVEPQP